MISRHRRAGDGFVSCACGRRHWGRFGAAGLLVQRGDEVLLQHRAGWSHEGGTWAVPGGALDTDETPLAAALREAAEEAAIPASAVRPRHAWTVDHGTWAYTTVVAQAIAPITPQRLDGESEELRWVHTRDVTALPLHSGFAAGWPEISTLLDRREVVVVDAANVVGSTPDGWWHDRAGAATRLLADVVLWSRDGIPPPGLLGEMPGRTLAWPDWVVVLEGAAREARLPSTPSGEAPPDTAGVVTVHRADASGDDSIVEAVEEHRQRGAAVTVVTADRGLRSRVSSLGAQTVGPRALPGR
jgi:8-oxo-dGTP diphosphatase